MSMLELQGVGKVYGQGDTVVNALRGVDLSVEPGAMVAVMGPSGSGKSTLLTIAGSLEEPTEGAVLIDGAPLSRMSRNAKARLRRRSIGYVFQDFNLLPGLTAVENVALPLELDGRPGRPAVSGTAWRRPPRSRNVANRKLTAPPDPAPGVHTPPPLRLAQHERLMSAKRCPAGAPGTCYPAEADAIRLASAAALSEAGSPCRCTTFQSPSSRRNTVVARSTYGCGGAPCTDAVVCSNATM